MSEAMIPVPATWAARSPLTAQQSADEHAQSLTDPTAYWRDRLAAIDWIQTPTRIDESSFDEVINILRSYTPIEAPSFQAIINPKKIAAPTGF